MEIPQVINQCVTAPGLAIHGSASALVKYNTFGFKVNGVFSPAITGADAPSLALATRNRPFPNGTAVVAGTLAFDNGTVPASTNSCRMYTLVATLPDNVENPVTVFSWLAGEDFPKHRQANSGDIAHPTAHNSVEVGYLYVKNETAAVFTPGTTALDTASLTVSYSDNYAKLGQ